MEINKFTDIWGVVSQEAIVEGRMVCIVPNMCGTIDFGSRADLAGMTLPHKPTMAAQAKYVSSFAMDNRPTPIVEPWPSTVWSLRGGWDQAQVFPMVGQSIWLDHPSNMLGQTIPSGYLALAFDRGVFTVYSGNFVIDHAHLVPGAHLVVCDKATDGIAQAGKLKYSATAGVAIVEIYDQTNEKLTFRTLHY